MSELLIDDYPIAFSPKLAKELGIKEAIVFEYIKFRISQDNEEGWSRITYDQMHQRLSFMNKTNIERIVKKMCKKNIISKKQLGAADGDRANWYAIELTFSEVEVLGNGTT